MEFFKIRRTIPFMRHALVFNVISLLTFAAAVFFLWSKGLNFSVEFTGGTLIEASYKQAADLEGIADAVENLPEKSTGTDWLSEAVERLPEDSDEKGKR